MEKMAVIPELSEIQVKSMSMSELESHLSNRFDDDMGNYFSVAGLDGEAFITLNRGDLIEIIPGPEKFLLRKKIMNYLQEIRSDSSPDEGIIQMARADFSLYSDTELIRANRVGKITSDTRDRCVRAVISNMITSCQQLPTPRYPCHAELHEMAISMCQKFQILKDDESLNPEKPWQGFLLKLKRRLANTKPVVKPQGPTPKKAKTVTNTDTNNPAITIHEDEPESQLEPNSQLTLTLVNEYDAKVMANHYEELKKKLVEKKPNERVIQQLLDLEFPARRNYITAIEGKNKVKRIMEVYPCFRKAVHIVDELRRYLGKDNDYLESCCERLDKFWDSMFLWGIRLNIISPSEKENKERTVLQNVSKLFPSNRKGKGVFKFLEKSEFLQENVKRSKGPPIVVLTETNIIVAVDGETVAVLAPGSYNKSMLVLMGIYYTFLLPYNTGSETFLSVIQSEILKDDIHSGDMTKDYKTVMEKFSSFLN